MYRKISTIYFFSAEKLWKSSLSPAPGLHVPLPGQQPKNSTGKSHIFVAKGRSNRWHKSESCERREAANDIRETRAHVRRECTAVVTEPGASEAGEKVRKIMTFSVSFSNGLLI